MEVLVNNTKAKVWSFYQINSITKNEKTNGCVPRKYKIEPE